MDPQQPNMVSEAFDDLEALKSDKKQMGYVPIRKDRMLEDVKQFLYNYCTAGRLYPSYHKQRIQHEREQEFMNKQDGAISTGQAQEAAPEGCEIESRRRLENTFINGQKELEKADKLRVLKIIQIVKQIVEKQLKSMKDKRMNSQKEGQIGDKQEIPKFEKNLIRQTESSPFITNIVPFAPKLGFGFGA